MKNLRLIKPLVSIFIIVGTLLIVVFVKMETRRLGYSILKKTRAEKNMIDTRKELEIRFARLTRPGRIEQLALKKLDLKKAQRGQIVQMYYDQTSMRTSFSRIE